MLRSVAVIAVAVASALAASQSLSALAEADHNNTAAPASVTVPLNEVAEAPAPDQPYAPAGSAQITKSKDGHYWAEAQVDGRWVHFLVDTGASTVALTAMDAQRLGYDLHNLDFRHKISTANGETMAALVSLDRVSVAGARVENVEALVVKDGLTTSLLGMTYLGRLSRFEATPTALILRP